MRGGTGNGNAIHRIWGTADQFLEKYKHISSLYEQALNQELQNPAISSIKRRVLQIQQHSPVMNFNLLNYQTRSVLQDMLEGPDVLAKDAMIENFGAPGFLYPSENTYRLSGKILTDRSAGAHPLITLADGLSMSIDPLGRGSSAISVSKTTLPTYQTLKSNFENERTGSLLGKIIEDMQSGRSVKILTADVESGGLGVFSQIRNLGAISTELGVDAAGQLRMSNITSSIAYQMATADTRGLDFVQRAAGAGSPTDLAELIFQRESQALDQFTQNLIKHGGIDATSAKELIDLTTKEGRLKAASAYKDFFSQALKHDYLAGHNIQFDIQKIMMSAGLIDEFYNDKEAMKLFADFGQMIKSGKVINTLDIVRSHQMKQATKIATAMGVTDPERTAMAIIENTYSRQALGKMGLGNVTPSSMQNLLVSSNFLDVIESSGAEGQDFIKLLAGGTTHQSQIDAHLTNYIIRYMRGRK